MLITSPKNPLVREILVLQEKSRERNRQGLILVEGQKEISLAVNAGVHFRKVVYQPEIISAEAVRELCGKSADKAEFVSVSEAVFAKISYRESTGGVVVVADKPEKTLDELTVRPDSVFIILEAVEKPGNLGAICRVADAAQVDGLIVCDPRTDIYNPNAIRSSLGCVFTVDVVSSDFESVQAWLKTNGIRSFAAELTAAEFYHETDLDGRIALVFGTEATGLTDKWIHGADKRIKIPMGGVIDSLNVNTSVAILVFEAMRRRGFKG
ncbi:RNA methyltransferase [Alistipes sp. OttesenSCG-928-L06]|nr:RNA methyltransferase [Alistipes sp. OttesenSCG-928-L06]